MSGQERRRAPQELWITGDPEADHLLTTSGNALLVGMVLDQQIPREKAFAGPQVIATRMGGTFDVPAAPRAACPRTARTRARMRSALAQAASSVSARIGRKDRLNRTSRP